MPDLEQLKIAAEKFKRGELAEAERVCRTLLRHNVWNIAAMNLLAGVLHANKKLSEALEMMERVVNLAPNVPEFHVNYGDLLLDEGNIAAAEERYRRATTLNSRYMKAWYQRGIAMERMKRTTEAVKCFQTVVQLNPQHVDAIIRLADIARVEGRVSDVLRCAEAILRVDPENLMGLRFRAGSLFNQGQNLEAIRDLRKVLQAVPKDSLMQCALVMSLNYDPHISPAQLRLEHEKACNVLYGHLMDLSKCQKTDPTEQRILRIGYVSSDFKDHAVTQFFQPVVAEHDRSKFQIFLYYADDKMDADTAWYRSHSDHWRDIFVLSTEQTTALIREDKIDILVDLSGFTGGFRLDVFACKPAPIQVTWLGYPSTTGLKTIDYLLSDPVVDPPDTPVELTEQIWRLPRAFSTFRMPRTNAEVSPLPALANGYITFGSMHALAKLNEDVLDLWCAVLKAIPTSKLLIYRSALLPSTHHAFRARFRSRGIEDQRLLLDYKMPPSGTHLTVYNRIDILLDSLPWNGHTTTCEALWMGVPTLTLLGNRHSGRMSASMLTQVGLKAFIARSGDEFVESARTLAADIAGLALLRKSLRDRMLASPLMDARLFVRELEEAFLKMWDQKRQLG